MLSIGSVAHAAGVTPRVGRYYEQQGLLASERTSGGQRRYPESAVERVRFIQRLIRSGLSSQTIRELLPCVDTGVADASTLRRLTAERERVMARAEELHQMGLRLGELITAAQLSVLGQPVRGNPAQP